MNKDAEGRWKVGMSNIKLKMRDYMENHVGTFELHCRYFADQAGFWTGEVHSTPFSFVVRDDGNNFDRPGFKIHEGPQ